MEGPRLREFTIGRHRTAGSLVRRVVDMILSRKLQPGDLLGHEADLIDQLGCSRPVLRETLRILEHEGTIEVKPGARGGVYCSVPDVRPLATSLQLYAAFHGVSPVALADSRCELEASMARLAAQRATPDELAMVKMSVERWRESCLSGDLAVAGIANRNVHAAIAQASHSPALHVLSDVVESILFREVYWSVGQDLPSIIDIHDELLTSLFERDGGAAAAAMRIHLRRFRARALEMEEQGWIAGPGGYTWPSTEEVSGDLN